MRDPELFRLHHVGVGVRNLSQSRRGWARLLGFTRWGDEVIVPSQRARTCLVQAGEARIELVEHFPAESGTEPVLGVYHLCFETPDLDAAIKTLQGRGFAVLSRFEQEAMAMRRWCYMVSSEKLLIELCEPAASDLSRSGTGAARIHEGY